MDLLTFVTLLRAQAATAQIQLAQTFLWITCPLVFFCYPLFWTLHSPFPTTQLEGHPYVTLHPYSCPRIEFIVHISSGKCTGAYMTTGSQSKACLSIHPILQLIPCSHPMTKMVFFPTEPLGVGPLRWDH